MRWATVPGEIRLRLKHPSDERALLSGSGSPLQIRSVMNGFDIHTVNIFILWGNNLLPHNDKTFKTKCNTIPQTVLVPTPLRPMMVSVAPHILSETTPPPAGMNGTAQRRPPPVPPCPPEDDDAAQASDPVPRSSAAACCRSEIPGRVSLRALWHRSLQQGRSGSGNRSRSGALGCQEGDAFRFDPLLPQHQQILSEITAIARPAGMHLGEIAPSDPRQHLSREPVELAVRIRRQQQHRPVDGGAALVVGGGGGIGRAGGGRRSRRLAARSRRPPRELEDILQPAREVQERALGLRNQLTLNLE